MTLNTTPADPNADSYAALADTDAYFAALGNLLWAATDAIKENMLRRATRYFENQYRTRWIGIRANQTQALAWPRVDGMRTLLITIVAYPLLDIDGFQIGMNEVPLNIQRATMEVALLALGGAQLEGTLSRDDQQIIGTRSQVDVMSKQITRNPGAPLYERYAVIEGLLRGYVTSTPGSAAGIIQMVRA